MIECPNCGRRYHGTSVWCACDRELKVCIHRGHRVGAASCKCGPIYKCSFHGGYCANSSPPDDLATINFDDGRRVEVRDLIFHGCQSCEALQSV